MTIAPFLPSGMAAAMAVALALALALLALQPGDRRSVRNAILFLGLCAVAELAAPWFGTARRSAGSLLAETASMATGLVLIRLGTIFVFRTALPALRARPARIVEDLATAALFVAWGLAWLRMSGVDPASLVTTSAVITAVLAFSMQQTLGNVLGGIVLQLDRSIRAGDWVRIDDVSGRIAEITWRHTAIETRNGETVMIPNGWMMSNRFTMIGTRADPEGPWRRWIRLNVDLASPPGEVCRVLEEAVRGADIENVLSSPPPNAVLMELGARHGGYALRYWMRDRGPDDSTDSRVRLHLLAALARHGMRLGVPFQEQLEVRDDDAHRAGAAAAEHRRRVDALAAVELFTPLADAEREALAPHLVYAPFVAGDVITRQGAIAHWLYLIVSGTAEVWFETPEGRRSIGALGPGEVFGEMGMMTGAPRRATVTARTDVTCYRLDKTGFETVIKARPDIAESMSKVLFARQSALAARPPPGAAAPAEHSRDILERIRRFFAIEA